MSDPKQTTPTAPAPEKRKTPATALGKRGKREAKDGDATKPADEPKQGQAGHRSPAKRLGRRKTNAVAIGVGKRKTPATALGRRKTNATALGRRKTPATALGRRKTPATALGKRGVLILIDREPVPPAQAVPPKPAARKVKVPRELKLALAFQRAGAGRSRVWSI